MTQLIDKELIKSYMHVYVGEKLKKNTKLPLITHLRKKGVMFSVSAQCLCSAPRNG